MATTSDSDEIPRLYGALKERVLANDKEGTIEIYCELLRLGRPVSEIMDQANRTPDDPQTGAPELVGEHSAGEAAATLLDEPPEPDGARPEPASARLVERTSAIIAERRGEPPDSRVPPAAAEETATVADDSGDQLPSPTPAA